MHFDTLLETHFDPSDVLPVLERIALQREEARLIALAQEPNPAVREDLFGHLPAPAVAGAKPERKKRRAVG